MLIRRLRGSDRGNILEISRHVWDGHDYLPSVFDHWLQDPSCHLYGIEVDNHVVVVGNLRLLENGRIGWMEGLRVHPDYRRRGFANKITTYLVRKAERLGVERLRYTTSAQNVASLSLAEMAGFSRIQRMAVSWHFEPKRLPEFAGYLPIRKRSPEAAFNVLEASPNLIPRGILIYDWKALDVSCQNLEELGKTHTFYIALRNRKVDSMSFGHATNDSNQPWWSFTTYARDSSGFISQLSYNMTIAFKHGLKSFVSTFETKFEKTVKAMDLGSEQQETRLVLLEKQIHPLKRRSRGALRP